MDVLVDYLSCSGFQSRLFLTPKFKAPWGLHRKNFPEVMFHYIVRGSCYIGRGKPKLKFEQMFPGDFVILPGGDDHALADSPSSKLVDPDSFRYPKTTQEMEKLILGGSGAETDIICGSFAFSKPGYEILLASLPRMILLRANDPERNPWIGQILNAIASEYQNRRLGCEQVVSNLLNILFMLVVRSCQDSLNADSRGLLAALKSPHVAAVLEQVHIHPEKDWTIDGLAKVAKLSRSAFSKRFSEFFDVGPAKYLNQVRLRKSVELLTESELSVKEIAAKVGFASSEVYIRNFQQEYGSSPSRYRNKPSPKKKAAPAIPTFTGAR